MALLSNEWVDLSMATDSGTGNGSTTAYVTTSSLKSQHGIWVTLDGLLQIITTDYTVSLGSNTITFVTAPAAGQKINIKYFIK